MRPGFAHLSASLRPAFLSSSLIVAAGLLSGCGGGQKESGAQVAIPDSALEDAKRSDAHYDALSKTPAKKAR